MKKKCGKTIHASEDHPLLSPIPSSSIQVTTDPDRKNKQILNSSVSKNLRPPPPRHAATQDTLSTTILSGYTCYYMIIVIIATFAKQ